MEYPVKVTAVRSFSEVVKNYPEIRSAVDAGVRFVSSPPPGIDLGKFRAASPVPDSIKKTSHKM